MGGAASTRMLPLSNGGKLISPSDKSTFPCNSCLVEVPQFDKMEELLVIANTSWEMVMATDEFTESGLKMTGSEMFAFVFNEKINSFDCGEHFVDLMNRAGVKYSINHSIGVIRFILQLSGKKQNTVLRKLRSIGRDHSGMMMTEEMLDPFFNACLFAISMRLGEHATNNVISAWATLFMFIGNGMAMDRKFDIDTPDDETVNSEPNSSNSRRRRSTREKPGDHRAALEVFKGDLSEGVPSEGAPEVSLDLIDGEDRLLTPATVATVPFS
jgi:hypothetical protein